jgi:hypothetical protein
MRTVTAPDGATWQVKRHWISRRPKWRRHGRQLDRAVDVGDVADVGLSLFDDTPFAWIFVIIAAIAILLFVTGIFALIIEILLIVIAVLGTLVAKVLFRRPWYVEASSTGHRRRWAVVGWKRTNEVMDELVRSIEAGTDFVSAHGRPLGVPIPTQERAAPEGGS